MLRHEESTGLAASNGTCDPQPDSAHQPTVAPIGRSIPEIIAEAAVSGMLGVLSGQLPLKHARAAHALGELGLRSEIAHQEYEVRRGFLLPNPHASGEVAKQTLGAARKS